MDSNDVKKSIIEIYENAVEKKELEKERSAIDRKLENFIEDNSFVNPRESYDDALKIDTAIEVFSVLAEKENALDLLKEFKTINDNLKVHGDKIKEKEQKDFILSKNLVESMGDSRGFNVIKIHLNSHMKPHKIMNEVRELSIENNIPHAISGSAAYMSVDDPDNHAKRCISNLLKQSKCKGDFLRAIFNVSDSMHNMQEKEKEGLVLLDNELIVVDEIKKFPHLFKEDMEKMKEELNKPTVSKNRPKM